MELIGQDATIMVRMTKIIGDVLKPGSTPLTFDKRIREDLGADSLDIVSLLMALEEEFGTTISDEDAKGLVTVGAVFEYVKVRQALSKS
jgi:acyl carrier protein